MRVLVTGGAGFIGSHLVDVLLIKGHSVTVLDDFSNGTKENLTHLQKKNLKVIKGDIRNASALKKALQDVDAVAHLAAMISVPLSIEKPALAHEVNVGGTLSLLKASLEKGVERFVCASSCAIYGDARKLPIGEKTTPKPLSPYAQSKLDAENSCRAFYEANGFPAVSLRYFNVYGPRQSGGEYAGVMLKFLERLRSGQPPVIYGDGSQTRDFVYVEDVAEATRLALERSNVEGEAINVGTMKRTSIKKLCEMFVKLSGRADSKPKHETARPGDIKHSQADISKAKKILGFRPKVSIEKGVKSLWESTGAKR